MANVNLTISNAEVDFPWSKNHLPTQLFINNEFVESVNPKKLEVFNPKDGSLVSNQVALAGEQDIDRAVATAEAAFQTWRKTLPTTRRDLLIRLADLIEKHASSFSELTRITLGAPIGGWGSIEVQYSCQALRYFAGWADKHSGELYNEEDGFLKIVRNEPLGVTAGIIPWNAPLGFVCNKAAPAIVTGNCIILKLSEKTPFAGIALGSLIKAAGFPPGVIQLLSGDGSSGALIASHMGIRKVSFTGSTATGRKIQEAAAKSNLKRVTLELGGKSPAIVFNDANLANAVQWCVNGITINSGQVCQAASRVYVQDGVYEKFADMYKKALEERARTTGDPDVMSTVVGPLADKHQFERVMGFIERGKADGNVLTGGHRLGEKGFYVSPTVFTNVDKDSEVVRKEIFGPVSVLNSFKTEEEVIELANDTNYGLAAGVFTQDINRALRLTTELEAGGVGVNCVSAVFWELPFGGMKESGLGRENGIHAIRSFTEPKAVYINLAY